MMERKSNGKVLKSEILVDGFGLRETTVNDETRTWTSGTAAQCNNWKQAIRKTSKFVTEQFEEGEGAERNYEE